MVLVPDEDLPLREPGRLRLHRRRRRRDDDEPLEVPVSRVRVAVEPGNVVVAEHLPQHLVRLPDDGEARRDPQRAPPDGVDGARRHERLPRPRRAVDDRRRVREQELVDVVLVTTPVGGYQAECAAARALPGVDDLAVEAVVRGESLEVRRQAGEGLPAVQQRAPLLPLPPPRAAEAGRPRLAPPLPPPATGATEQLRLDREVAAGVLDEPLGPALDLDPGVTANELHPYRRGRCRSPSPSPL